MTLVYSHASPDHRVHRGGVGPGDRSPGTTLAEFDADAAAAGLELGHRFAIRDLRRWQAGRRLGGHGAASAPLDSTSREPHPRYRRLAQRRQVDPVQRPDPQQRAGGELRLRHIEPNVGVAPLPDDRLGRLAEMRFTTVVPAAVSFVDIAGIVAGASEGAGLGNRFLADIREADAICQVVRVCDDPDVLHVECRVDPREDIATATTMTHTPT